MRRNPADGTCLYERRGRSRAREPANGQEVVRPCMNARIGLSRAATAKQVRRGGYIMLAYIYERATNSHIHIAPVDVVILDDTAGLTSYFCHFRWLRASSIIYIYLL